MLVCSCNVISKSAVESVIQSLLDEDQWQLITPGRVYHAMKKRGQCCSCFPNIISVIVAETEKYHRQAETPEAEIIPFIAKIRSEYDRTQAVRNQLSDARNA
jgi:bacterioferritin-associated ferredoxin